ncbi:alpha/beta hydrolase [Planctomycetota bacterium]
MTDDSGDDWKAAFAETAFKRLYWQGFRGQFVSFNWPTLVSKEGSRSPDIFNMTYNPSEMQAFRSGKALRNLLDDLQAFGGAQNVHLLAHSMGNVVAGEALRNWSEASTGPLVDTYIAMEGAFSAGAYGYPSNGAFTLQLGSFAWDQTERNVSDIDLYRHWPTGDPTSTSHYMNGAASASQNWVNIYNPDDFATNQMWRLNNLSKFYTNNPTPILPNLVGYEDNSIWDVLLDQYSGVADLIVPNTLPPTDVWKWRYVVWDDPDNSNVREYWRVPYLVEGTFYETIQEVRNADLGGGIVSEQLYLTNADGTASDDAYEIIAFMSQANAEAIGNVSVPWFDTNINIHPMITTQGEDPSDAGSHSFQFHHDAVKADFFWSIIASESGFNRTYSVGN